MTTYPLLRVERVQMSRAVKPRYIPLRLTETPAKPERVQLQTTQSGRDLLRMAGKCIAAGGAVNLVFDRNARGEEFATGVLDWRPANAEAE